MKDPTPRKKPNILLRLITFLLSLAILLGAVALVVYRDRLNLDALVRWVQYRTLETNETGQAEPFFYGGGTAVDLGCLDGALLFSSQNGVRLFTNLGDELVNDVFTLSNPVQNTSGRLGVVYDMGGQELRAYDSRGQVFSLTLEEGYGLLSARPNDAGWLAVTAQQSGWRGVVTVYSSEFSPQMSLRYSSSFAIDAVLSPDSGTVAAVTMGQDGTSFESQLVLYHVGQEEPAATLSLGNTTVLDLAHSGSAVRVLGESSLLLAASDGSQVVSYNFSDRYLKGYDLGGDDFSLILLGRYRAGTASELLVIGDDGLLISRLDPDAQILDLSAAGRYFAVLTSQRLDIYTKDLTLYASLEDTQGAQSIQLRDDGSVLLADGESAWLYLP